MDGNICSLYFGEQKGEKGEAVGICPLTAGALTVPCAYCSSEALCWEAVSSRPMSSWLALLQTTPMPEATASARRRPRRCLCSGPSVESHGSEKCRVAWLAVRAEGPIMMLTLLDDWVSLVLPPSAAERPEMTRALEKLLLPKRKLRVELVDEPRLDLMSASARSRTLRWPVVVTGGGCECRDAAEVCKDSRLPDSLGASPWTDEDVCKKAWWLSKIGPDELKMGGLWLNAPCAWTD